MAPKRPLGLAKTKKERGNPAKRQRTDNQTEDIALAERPDADVAVSVDVTTDDWEDLKELFSRAQGAFLGDPAIALPLFRGVIHEADRMWRQCPDPSIFIVSATHDQEQNLRESPAAFFALYGDALIHCGDIIGRDPELVVEGEPDSPLAYLEAALDIIESGTEKANAGSPPNDDWKLHYAWTRALILLASAKISQRDAEEVQASDTSTPSSSSIAGGQLRRHPDSSSGDLLSIAVEHYNVTLSQLPKIIPSLRKDRDAEEDIPSIRVPSKSEVCCTIGTLVFDVAELLPSSERRHYWTNWATEALEEGQRHLGEDELQVEYRIAKGQGRILLASLPDLLGEDFDEDPNIIELPEAPKARTVLENAVSLFDCARHISSTLRPNSQGNADDEELRNLLSEALLYFAYLTEDNETSDALFARAKEEGVDLSESGDEAEDDSSDQE